MKSKTGREHPDDARLIDFLMGNSPPDEAAAVRERLATDDQFARRSGSIAGVLKLLDRYTVEDPSEELTRRTVAAVQSATRTTALLDKEAAQARPASFPSFTLRELGAIAALLLLVAGILLPSIRQARDLQKQQACLGQAGEIGAAMNRYAGDHGGNLPHLGVPNAVWLGGMESTQPRSNSRNLWKLVVGGYAQPVLFQCPAGSITLLTIDSNAEDFPSGRYIRYSYHNSVNAAPLNPERLIGHTSEMAILADSTPLFRDGRLARDGLQKTASPNHGGQGQAVLYLDMHAAWQTGSRVGVEGDDIWRAGNRDEYRGDEQPTKPTDSFLLPCYVPE